MRVSTNGTRRIHSPARNDRLHGGRTPRAAAPPLPIRRRASRWARWWQPVLYLLMLATAVAAVIVAVRFDAAV
jgi:hypothetical protein